MATEIGFDENTGQWFKRVKPDIVERLRHPMVMRTDVNDRTQLHEPTARLDMLEAADTIEKLRQEVMLLLGTIPKRTLKVDNADDA